MTWHPLGPVTALRFDPGACVTVAGRELAVFRAGNAYHALDNSCPHQGGALAEGIQLGNEVVCPWHGWRFDLRTGACATVAKDATRSYRVRESAGQLEVELPPV